MDGIAKLKEDLLVLEQMAAEMDDYLRSDVLFWPMAQGNMPRLTLGGFLMRQHRLLALNNLLEPAERTRLQQALETYRGALVEKVVRFESRAHEELETRLRQWQQTLNSYLKEEANGSKAYYATSVETRAQIEALISQLQMAPYKLNPRLLEQRDLLDNYLRSRFRSGDFVWPEAWKPAYPRETYWWLYGMPG